MGFSVQFGFRGVQDSQRESWNYESSSVLTRLSGSELGWLQNEVGSEDLPVIWAFLEI